MAPDRKCFTVTWRIENYSFPWHRFADPLSSPVFPVDSMDGTRWKLGANAVGDRVYFHLIRYPQDVGPAIFELDYDISLLACNGSPLKRINKDLEVFWKGWSGVPLKVTRDEILVEKKDTLLPQDVLTVQCKMWNRHGLVPEVGHCYALTRVGVESVSFVLAVDQLGTDPRGYYLGSRFISTESKEKPWFCVRVMGFGGTVKLSIQLGECPIRESVAFGLQLFFVDDTGSEISCGNYDTFFKSLKWNSEWEFKLKHRASDVCDRLKKEKSQGDRLITFRGTLSHAVGVDSKSVGKDEAEFLSFQNALRDARDPEPGNNSSATAERPEWSSTLEDDMLFLYRNPILSDIKLRTLTESLPAHRIVLSMRSPVFRAMLTSDMKEKANEFVDIQDLDSDTVRKMLQFLYTDTVEDLDWERVKSLYFAADKYQILPLRQKCSSFLKGNLKVPNCCDILVLADVHSDKALKRAVLDFVAIHDDEIIHTNEWRNLEKNYFSLATETLRYTYIENKKPNPFSSL